MKILEVGMGPNIGGIEMYFHNYYRHFSKDFFFDFINKDGGLAFSDEYAADGCSIYHMPSFKKQPVRYFSKLTRILKDGGYDAIHINMLSAANILPVFAGRFTKTKVIVHSHNSGTPSGFSRKVLHYINKPLLNFADIYLACSNLAGRWMFGNKQFTVISNAIDLTVFNVNNDKRSKYRKELGLSENDYVIGHVGRFAEQKNHAFIIETFLELQEKSKNYKLLLVGDGELKESIINKFAELGLSDSVIFTGNVSNVQDYMQAMDLFILPSLFEGLPVTGVEAQACGLPCVFSDTITTEIKITDNVEFASLDNKDKWIETIEKMIALPKADNTEKIRAAGYDIRDTAKKLEEIYMNR